MEIYYDCNLNNWIIYTNTLQLPLISWELISHTCLSPRRGIEAFTTLFRRFPFAPFSKTFVKFASNFNYFKIIIKINDLRKLSWNYSHTSVEKLNSAIVKLWIGCLYASSEDVTYNFTLLCEFQLLFSLLKRFSLFYFYLILWQGNFCMMSFSLWNYVNYFVTLEWIFFSSLSLFLFWCTFFMTNGPEKAQLLHIRAAAAAAMAAYFCLLFIYLCIP